MIMISNIIAILAPVMNGMYQIPQLVKVITSRSVDDLSLYTLLLLLTTNILWLLHGYFISDVALIVSAFINIFINVPLIYLFFKYNRNK